MDFYRWVMNQWDRALAVALGLLGLLAIFLGWLGVSGKVLPSEQIPYLASGGVLGLFLLGAGATLWLSADMRDEWRKLDEVVDELRAANRLSEAALAQNQATEVAPTSGANGRARKRTEKLSA
jgi:hypothetical protein